MPRPRKAAEPGNFAKLAHAVGGGGVGTALEFYAQNVPEPYRHLVVLAAPALAVVWAQALQPVLLAFSGWIRVRAKILRMKSWVKSKKRQLPSLNAAMREKAEREIAEVEEAIHSHEYHMIEPYVEDAKR